jgi:hypothetical protein
VFLTRTFLKHLHEDTRGVLRLKFNLVAIFVFRMTDANDGKYGNHCSPQGVRCEPTTRADTPVRVGKQLEAIEIFGYSPAVPKGEMIESLCVLELPIRIEVTTRIEVIGVGIMIFIARH